MVTYRVFLEGGWDGTGHDNTVVMAKKIFLFIVNKRGKREAESTNHEESFIDTVRQYGLTQGDFSSCQMSLPFHQQSHTNGTQYYSGRETLLKVKEH